MSDVATVRQLTGKTCLFIYLEFQLSLSTSARIFFDQNGKTKINWNSDTIIYWSRGNNHCNIYDVSQCYG